MKHEITELQIDSINAYDNPSFCGLHIYWVSNIGWGECNIYKAKDGTQWKADTEHMCSNEDKTFLKMLLDKLADMAEVTG